VFVSHAAQNYTLITINCNPAWTFTAHFHSVFSSTIFSDLVRYATKKLFTTRQCGEQIYLVTLHYS